MQSHEEYRDLLSALLDGELTPDERGEVEKHLAECAECRERLEALRATAGLARENGGIPDPGEDYWERFDRLVEMRIDLLPRRGGSDPMPWSVRLLRIPAFRIGVPVALAATVLIVFLHSQTTDRTDTAPQLITQMRHREAIPTGEAAADALTDDLVLLADAFAYEPDFEPPQLADLRLGALPPGTVSDASPPIITSRPPRETRQPRARTSEPEPEGAPQIAAAAPANEIASAGTASGPGPVPPAPEPSGADRETNQVAVATRTDTPTPVEAEPPPPVLAMADEELAAEPVMDEEHGESEAPELAIAEVPGTAKSASESRRLESRATVAPTSGGAAMARAVYDQAQDDWIAESLQRRLQDPDSTVHTRILQEMRLRQELTAAADTTARSVKTVELAQYLYDTAMLTRDVGDARRAYDFWRSNRLLLTRVLGAEEVARRSSMLRAHIPEDASPH